MLIVGAPRARPGEKHEERREIFPYQGCADAESCKQKVGTEATSVGSSGVLPYCTAAPYEDGEE